MLVKGLSLPSMSDSTIGLSLRLPFRIVEVVVAMLPASVTFIGTEVFRVLGISRRGAAIAETSRGNVSCTRAKTILAVAIRTVRGAGGAGSLSEQSGR
jgi:hypothetical protein